MTADDTFEPEIFHLSQPLGLLPQPTLQDLLDHPGPWERFDGTEWVEHLQKPDTADVTYRAKRQHIQFVVGRLYRVSTSKFPVRCIAIESDSAWLADGSSDLFGHWIAFAYHFDGRVIGKKGWRVVSELSGDE